MSDKTQQDPAGKAFLRRAWRAALMMHAVATTLTAGGGGSARVFYGGARGGNLGGPLVKVKRLQQYFPEHRWRYNLIYLLSNAPYLLGAGLDMAIRRRIPIVLNQNGVFYPAWFNGDWRDQNVIMATAYHRASHVFWQSEFCRRAANRFLGERQGPGEILFNAVDVQFFRPGVERKERPFTFLLSGKIGKHLGYRVDSTFAGLAYARRAGLDARLIIAGWVEDIRAVHAMAKNHGVAGEVTFTGPYTQEQAPDIYQRADAYVMTKYLDPCPNTVLEALASGLPVLYSGNGGVPELVGSEAGVGLPVPEDWENIHVPSAAAIGQGMLKISSAAPAMAMAARARAIERFDISAWIKRHAELFNELLAGVR